MKLIAEQPQSMQGNIPGAFRSVSEQAQWPQRLGVPVPGCDASAAQNWGRPRQRDPAEPLSIPLPVVQSPPASSSSSCLCGLIEFGQWWLHSAHEISSFTICWERQPKGVTPWAFNQHLIQHQELMTLEPLQQSFPHPFPECPAFSEQ